MRRTVCLSLLLAAGCPPVDAPGKDETDTVETDEESDTTPPVDDTDTTPPRDTAPDTDDLLPGETDETDPPGVDTDETDEETDHTDTVDTDTVDTDTVDTDTVDTDAPPVDDTALPVDTTPPRDTAPPHDSNPPPVETATPPDDSAIGESTAQPDDSTAVPDDSGGPPPDDSAAAPHSGAGPGGETGSSGHDSGGAIGETASPPDTGSPDTADSGSGGFSAALTVDGDLADCPAEAVFATSSGAGTWACITWDDDNLYLGFHHPDVGAGGSEHWMWAYLGGMTSPGAFNGVAYGNQQPAVPAIFQGHLRWKASGTTNGLLHWTGLAWGNEDVDYLWTTGDVAEDNGRNDVEMRVPLSDVTNTGLVIVALGWTHTTPGSESTYASVPSVGFSDSFDPDIGAWFVFDLSSPDAPNSYSPILAP
ncbi:MAG TPA: hypothetical protein PKA64_25495 [Myxococcota bacterium]|nr:hypothetical protein [Myxococcota bacterium]